MENVTYEVLENGLILRSDGWVIPTDESNSDYQRYLRWLNGEDEAQSL